MFRPHKYAIPAWQDIETLSWHLCISESTLEKWVREGKLPRPRKIGGKNLWRWQDIDDHLVRSEDDPALSSAEAIREATRRVVGGG
jgi:predicted DNA-binding transcriptional regulator AlpA